MLDKIFLPKLVPMDLAIAELGLSEMPEVRAIKIILQYAAYDGLPIIFSGHVCGIDQSIMLGAVYDEYGQSIDYLVAEDLNDIQHIDSEKIIIRAHTYKSNKKRYISISSFSKNDVSLNVVHESGQRYSEIDVLCEDLFIYKKELQSFIKRIDQDDAAAVKKSASKGTGSSTRVSGVDKALALLARDKAEGNRGYQTGNKVNASAFKDHVIKLAKIYLTDPEKVNDHGLKQLDGNISNALDKLDIKEIPD